ncbi:AraC family transcriptional regulator [Actinomadura fulvescens]|uniref:AraC family transcriptional regulator n=2 Tax=Actinomadura fulvescens TaxID=46160 RepID=A0ABN3PPF7_9ACTN
MAMDALTDLLDGPRARGAFMLRAMLDPPWSLRIEDEAPLCLTAVVKGTAWVVPDDGDALRLGPGDIAITRGPDHYTVADDRATPPQMVIHPGNRCTTLYGEPLAEKMALGVRSWGNSADGETVMLIGTYHMRGEITQRLLAALPPLLVLPADAWDNALVAFLGQEIVKDDPGQEAVLDRLLDLLLISSLRAWFNRPGANAPGWFKAHGDPVVGPALQLLHDDMAHPWTVASLAAKTGVSRAALAQRFGKLVGEPPMSYLTGLRLAQAADMLRETDSTLEAVARKVGYSNAFALSTAFKRVRGLSPQEYRERATA